MSRIVSGKVRLDVQLVDLAAVGRLSVDTMRPAADDIGMPGESGYSLIRAIRGLPGDAGGATPAVALTAFARTDDRTEAILAGFQHHVAKPVEPAELIAMVASLTQRSVVGNS